ncbi:MAG: DUF4321 domain-containing protein [Calditrichaeota bacterium]|nr:DUF4321 domain-containing protein [Calditrichota bacterium]
MRRYSVGFLALVLFLGAVVGSALGELIGSLLPTGVVHDFFLKSVTAGFGPATLDALVFSITLGVSFRLNVVGIVGILLVAYVLRWYR